MSVIRSDIELLKFTTAGSVDDGKSTLIGRLLHDCNAIFEDQLLAVSKASKKRGDEEVDLALLLDGLSDEREQGITIDVAYRYFSTPKRKFIIADVPGHEQYTRNMVTGASTADLALILIDARKGFLIQSKRHLFVAALLGIPHIMIVVNKMDLMDYDQNVYDEIVRDVVNFAAKLEIKDLQFIPVSALTGDMVVERGGKLPWYEGPTLLSYLENVHVMSDRNLIDFRFPVQYVIRPNQDFRGYAGRIEGGVVKKGQKVMVLPSGVTTEVESIIYDDTEVDYAFNSQSVVISLKDEVDVARGNMIVREGNLPEMGREIEANVCWFSEEPMQVNKRYLLKHTTKVVPCFVEELKYRLNIDTLHREEAAGLELNEIGRISVRTNEPLMFDVYSKNRTTGSFIIVDELTNNTVGAGIILNKGKKNTYLRGEGALKMKKGGVLWFTGLSGSGKSTIADKLYEYLGERGVMAERLDGDVMRQSLSKDLGFSKEDRYANIERAGFVAGLLAKHGVLVTASFISPYLEQREALRGEVSNYVEIYVNTPLDVCEARDVKGLYARVRSGEIDSFTGISDPYEVPENPDIEILTEEESVDQAVEKIVAYLLENAFIDLTS